MKVFEVIVLSCYEFEPSITTDIFDTKEKAEKYFLARCEDARLSAEDELDEDERVIDSGEDWYDAYLDGRANEWEIQVRLKEKEVQ